MLLPYAVLLLPGLAAAALLRCSSSEAVPAPALPTVARHPWYTREHHREGRFANLEPPLERPFWRSVRWIARKLLSPQRQHPPTPFEPLSPHRLREPSPGLRFAWLGHSTVLLQLPTATLLTDPIFSQRASPVSFAGPLRQVPVPLAPDSLPHIDIVLLSHDHYDHLDRASVEFLARRFDPLFLVPLGVGKRLRTWGIRRVVELDWWEYVDYAGLRIHCTPARHFSGRGLTDRNRTLWASWYVHTHGDDALRIYFAGDTGFGVHFELIRTRLGAPLLCLMPIGAYEPRWFMREVHVDPAEALRAAVQLGARHLLPIHWGTFDQADEGLQDPPRQLLLEYRRRAASEQLPQLHLLPVGGVDSLLSSTP
jgi:N-acyl-phosphatidylethanolamine-hydrolysing phospholipase D